MLELKFTIYHPTHLNTKKGIPPCFPAFLLFCYSYVQFLSIDKKLLQYNMVHIHMFYGLYIVNDLRSKCISLRVQDVYSVGCL